MSTEPTGLRAAPMGPGPSLTAWVGDRDAEPAADGGRRMGRAARAQRAPSVDSRKPSASEGPGPGRKSPPRRKRKVRKVHRVVRHVEVWSIAKITAVFVACGYVVVMISGYLLWRAADRVGTVEGIEGFMEDSGGYDSYQILGDVVFKVAGVALLVLALLTVATVVLAAVLFNLVSDVTGGIRMTVIDEDLIVVPARRPEADAARRPEADAARRPEADAARRPEADAARRPEADAARRPPPVSDAAGTARPSSPSEPRTESAAPADGG